VRRWRRDKRAERGDGGDGDAARAEETAAAWLRGTARRRSGRWQRGAAQTGKGTGVPPNAEKRGVSVQFRVSEDKERGGKKKEKGKKKKTHQAYVNNNYVIQMISP
jgi:hypothetical protein